MPPILHHQFLESILNKNFISSILLIITQNKWIMIRLGFIRSVFFYKQNGESKLKT